MFKKEKILQVVKKVGGGVLIVTAVVSGYAIGRYQNSKSPTPQKPNPYAHVLKPSEVSIAVNESGELLFVERKTGKYIVYSNEIGMNVFKMYSNKIYQEVTDEN